MPTLTHPNTSAHPLWHTPVHISMPTLTHPYVHQHTHADTPLCTDKMLHSQREKHARGWGRGLEAFLKLAKEITASDGDGSWPVCGRKRRERSNVSGVSSNSRRSPGSFNSSRNSGRNDNNNPPYYHSSHCQDHHHHTVEPHMRDHTFC